MQISSPPYCQLNAFLPVCATGITVVITLECPMFCEKALNASRLATCQHCQQRLSRKKVGKREKFSSHIRLSCCFYYLNLGKVQASVARCLRTPPYAAKRKGLKFGFRNSLRCDCYRSTIVICNCTLWADTVAPSRNKANPFRRSSILFRPHDRQMSGYWWSRRVPPPGPIRVLRARLCS